MNSSRRVFLVGLTAMTGCTAVGPEFALPDAKQEEGFLTGSRASIGDASSDVWWADFGDATLTRFVERGLSANLNVRTALTRIEQADAAVRQTGLNSQVNGNASSSYTRSGGDSASTTNTESYALSGAYVIDLFGGVRRGRERSLAELEAAGFSAADARLAFLSGLMGNYIAARFHQTAAELTRRSIKLRQRTVQLVNSQLNEGAATKLDLVRAEADLQSTQAELPGFRAGFNASVFAIATLIDQPISKTHQTMQRGAPQPWPRTSYAKGTPANLLRNVPSIRANERRLAASVAAIGVAESQLYPSLTLSGTLNAGTSDSWAFGPEFVVPVFNRGLLQARRDQAIAVAKEAELNWRSAVRHSVQSVEVSASNLSNNRQQVTLLRRSVASQERSLNLSRSVYENGTLSLLDLLETERTTLGQQITLASAVRDAAISWVELQIATGRGWNT